METEGEKGVKREGTGRTGKVQERVAPPRAPFSRHNEANKVLALLSKLRNSKCPLLVLIFF